LEQYPTESVAQAAADALRLTINNASNRRNLRQTTVNILWEHYCREELPQKEMSTQDAYSDYAKNWILPRWGSVLLEEIKTVEVERWLRAAEVADGTEQTFGAWQAGGCHLAGWFAAGEQINSYSVVGVGARVLGLVRGNARRAECFEGLLDPNGPRFFLGLSVSA